MAVVLMAVFVIVFYINRSNNEPNEKEDGKIKVVTSFYPVYVLTKNLTRIYPFLRWTV